MKDYYTLLNVKPTASPAQIDAAYRRLMHRHHPNARSSHQALDRMRELNEAWRVLSDSSQRAAYDRARTNGIIYEPPTPPPTLRAIPQANLADFGARRATGGTCFVGIAVAAVLIFAFGILTWGLNEQLNFGAMFERAAGEINALLPARSANETRVAEESATPTPDPRCRDGCETPPAGCVVKGAVEPDGTRFFYLPNDEGYARVNVDIAKGDRWFCALTDAQAAGWARKAPTETPTFPPPPEAFTTSVARRAFVVCGENVALHQGPGDDFPVAQTKENGARLFVTGVNGEWSVINQANGTLYVRTNLLCAPTRASSQPTPAVTDSVPPTPVPSDTVPPTQAAQTIASSAAIAFKYPAPQLIVPTNGARYWCNRELILQWDVNGVPLGADEFFLIESKLVEHERWDALSDWTKETTVMLSPNRGEGSCDSVWWSNTGVYEWRVSIVRGSKEMPTYLSPFSEKFRINYGQ
jgi:hypothetical protein